MKTQRFRNRTFRNVVVTLVIASGVMLSATAASAQNGNPNPGVHPIGSRPYGRSYGEWSARWWQWIYSIPTPVNPNFDSTGADCAEGQSGHVWFLAGTFGGPAERTCTIPAGVSLLLPIINLGFGDGQGDCNGQGPFFDSTLKSCDAHGVWVALVASVAGALDDPTLDVSIDGVPLRDLVLYRAQAPKFSYSPPTDNILTVVFGSPRPAGTYFPAGSDGYWLMFTPLPPGNHTINSRGVFGPGPFVGFEVDLTYHLIVRHGNH
jgi:hypothetical protein